MYYFQALIILYHPLFSYGIGIIITCNCSDKVTRGAGRQPISDWFTWKRAPLAPFPQGNVISKSMITYGSCNPPRPKTASRKGAQVSVNIPGLYTHTNTLLIQAICSCDLDINCLYFLKIHMKRKRMNKTNQHNNNDDN